MVISSSAEATEIFQDYTFNLEELNNWIKSNNYKLVALQLPEGLKSPGLNLLKTLEAELGITVILLADPCFGACDVGSDKIEPLGVDAIVHLGHAEIPNLAPQKIPVKFIELKANLNPCELIIQEKNMKLLRSEFELGSSLGLFANIQFIEYLDEMKSVLEKENFQVNIGVGDSRIKHHGQILGCNFSSASAVSDKVSGFLFIGDGIFHPLGISLATNKKVLAYDPFSDVMQNIDSFRDKILRQRNGAIGRAKDCKNFGILLSAKPGQNRLAFALKLKKKLEQSNLQGTLLALDNISPGQIDYLPFEAYINTACPRLVIDDYQQFKKVLITPIELEIILGERTWENYIFDEII